MAGAGPPRVASRGEFDDFAIAFPTDEAMNPHIACVVPDVLGLDLEGEVMCGFLPVVFCVPAFVAPTTYVAADEADPEIVC